MCFRSRVSLQSSAFYNFGAATAAAVPFIGVVLLGILISERVLHKKDYSFRLTTHRLTRIPLERKAPLVLLAVASLAVVLVGFPLIGVLWRGASVPALSDAIQRAGASAVRSIVYAAIASSALCILGFFPRIYRASEGSDRLVVSRYIDSFPICDSRRRTRHRTDCTLEPAIDKLDLRNARHFSSSVFIAQYAALGTRTILAGFSPNCLLRSKKLQRYQGRIGSGASLSFFFRFSSRRR